MVTRPTLHDLHQLPSIQGIRFWCCNYACQHHDTAPTGHLAIDYGPALTFADLERFTFCVECYGRVQARPDWRVRDKSLVG
jgi:hypothetical protein